MSSAMGASASAPAAPAAPGTAAPAAPAAPGTAAPAAPGTASNAATAAGSTPVVGAAPLRRSGRTKHTSHGPGPRKRKRAAGASTPRQPPAKPAKKRRNAKTKDIYGDRLPAYNPRKGRKARVEKQIRDNAAPGASEETIQAAIAEALAGGRRTRPGSMQPVLAIHTNWKRLLCAKSGTFKRTLGSASHDDLSAVLSVRLPTRLRRRLGGIPARRVTLRRHWVRCKRRRSMRYFKSCR
jgi:hypothetical protein